MPDDLPGPEAIRRLKQARSDYGEWCGAAEQLRQIFPPSGYHRIARDGRRLAREGTLKPKRRLPRRSRVANKR